MLQATHKDAGYVPYWLGLAQAVFFRRRQKLLKNYPCFHARQPGPNAKVNAVTETNVLTPIVTRGIKHA